MVYWYIIISLLLLIGLYIYIVRDNYLRTKVKETITKKVVLKIAVPIDNDKKPLAAEQLLNSLHGILQGEDKSPEHFSLEIFSENQGIYFIVVCSERYKQFIENQFYAQYPNSQIITIHDYIDVFTKAKAVKFLELKMKLDSFFPLKTFENFDVDPLASITASMSKLPTSTYASLQIVARPINNKWQQDGLAFIKTETSKKDEEGKPIPVDDVKKKMIEDVEKKNNKPGFQFVIRIAIGGNDSINVNNISEDIVASLKQFQTGYNSLEVIKPAKGFINKTKAKLTKAKKKALLMQRTRDKLDLGNKFANRFIDEFEGGIVNIEELASLYHLPDASVKTPNIAWVKSKKLEYPLNLPFYNQNEPDNTRYFGVTDYRGSHLPFGIKNEDRRRHMYLVGKTGSGKSSYFLRTMIVGDILQNKGVCVLDPHGDLVEEILDLIPENRMKDVIYLDPSDTEFPIGLNMLDLNKDETMDLLADGIVSVFKKFFGESWGPRLQYILTNTILTLLHCQNVSLLAVQRILTDTNYRNFLLKQVEDPFLLKFWSEEYEKLAQNPRLLTEAIAPIQNKVGRFLGSPMVRNMIGQLKSSVNLTDVMNDGKILLVNLSQGKIGEENSSLLGGMLVTRIYTNAMQRANLEVSQRKDFYLYVDEFQNFATDTFIKILSEARKYGLNLVVTHQYLDQVSPEIQDAIFGNVGTLMNFVVGQKDASRLEREFAPYLNSEDLVNLERFRLTMKMTIDGAQSAPFTAIALRPNFTEFKLKQQIKEASRGTYASPRGVVEAKLNKWASQEYDKQGNLVQKGQK